MNIFKKPVSASAAPNFEKDDVLLSVKLILKLIRGARPMGEEEKVKRHLSRLFDRRPVFLFSSGRAALFYSLKALGLKVGDQVLLQALTCVAVPNSIVWAGLEPVYVDIDKKTFNFDLGSLRSKIGKRTKAILVQHTFGSPSPMEEIVKMAKKESLFIIEDCAHGLGSTYKGQRLGLFGDISFFSFGRDKVLSSVFGGAAISKNKKVVTRLSKAEKKLVDPPIGFILQQLLYPIVYYISLPVYRLGLGKVLLRTFSLFGLISRSVYRSEKKGRPLAFINYQFSPFLLSLLDQQLKKLKRFTQHRKKISQFYLASLKLPLPVFPYLRLPFLVKNRDEILLAAKKEGFLLGDWYSAPVAPVDVDLKAVSYAPGSCPVAEELSCKIINLPTHINISLRQAEEIVNLVKNRAKLDAIT